MGGAQALKRIPRIKFPTRHPTSSSAADSVSQNQGQGSSASGSADHPFFSSLKAPNSVGGKASLQPKRTPVSNSEIEAILFYASRPKELGGSI